MVQKQKKNDTLLCTYKSCTEPQSEDCEFCEQHSPTVYYAGAPELRNLSGIYFREERDGKWTNVVWEDLSEASQDKIITTKSPIFIANLAKQLGQTIRRLGTQFDIMS